MQDQIDELTRLTLKQPENRFMWLGAVLASNIPMAVGALLVWFARYAPNAIERFIGFMCLVLTPIVCWKCWRYVMRESEQNNLEIIGLTKFTVMTAVKWQIIVGILHFIYLFTLGRSSYSEMDISFTMGVFVIMALGFHIGIVLFITMPLSLICTLIFRFTALKRIR